MYSRIHLYILLICLCTTCFCRRTAGPLDPTLRVVRYAKSLGEKQLHIVKHLVTISISQEIGNNTPYKNRQMQ